MFAMVYNKTTGSFAASIMVNSAAELAPVITNEIGVLLGQYDLTMTRVDLSSKKLALTDAGTAAGYTLPAGPMLFIEMQ